MEPLKLPCIAVGDYRDSIASSEHWRIPVNLKLCLLLNPVIPLTGMYDQCLSWPKILCRVFKGATAQSHQQKTGNTDYGTATRWSATHATRTDCMLSASTHPKFSVVQSRRSGVSNSCDLMDCSTPGFPVHHQLLEFAQTHVHWISDGIQPSHPLSSPFPPAFNLSQRQSIFPTSHLFTSGGQSIRASASASVLPMNSQDWFPLGLTGWISLQSKGLSRIFPNTTVQNHQFLSAQLLYSSTLTSIHDYWKKYSFD